MGSFWDGRFAAEGKIWGDAPSKTALHACALFSGAGVRTVLVPGSGYGRNAKAFHSRGFSVTGIEISGAAQRIAAQDNPGIRYHTGSVLDMPFDSDRYDGIYCFCLLHLLLKDERAAFIRMCREQLGEGGVVYFVVFSELEESFGRGPLVEENTFESKPGRPVHYFTGDDLASHFTGFGILESGLTEEPEEHGAEGRHVHHLRYMYARRD